MYKKRVPEEKKFANFAVFGRLRVKDNYFLGLKMNKQAQAFFITGTGTAVGKTIITAGIASLCVKTGQRVSIMKPVQTGVPEYPADLTTISSLVEGLVKLPEEIAMPYCFQLPASPHLASQNESVFIDPEKIKQAFLKVMEFDVDILLLEGAGGINVPLNENYLTWELIKELKIPVIVTALSGLGTINHTLLTLNQLKQAEIDIAGVIFNMMPLEPGRVARDNIKTIERISGVPILGVIREFADKENVTQSELLFEFSKQQKLKELLSL